MPNNRAYCVETAMDNAPNGGAVASGRHSREQWQHVAAVVRRGENQTRLFIGGFPVAKGVREGAR